MAQHPSLPGSADPPARSTCPGLAAAGRGGAQVRGSVGGPCGAVGVAGAWPRFRAGSGGAALERCRGRTGGRADAGDDSRSARGARRWPYMVKRCDEGRRPAGPARGPPDSGGPTRQGPTRAQLWEVRAFLLRTWLGRCLASVGAFILHPTARRPSLGVGEQTGKDPSVAQTAADLEDEPLTNAGRTSLAPGGALDLAEHWPPAQVFG